MCTINLFHPATWADPCQLWRICHHSGQTHASFGGFVTIVGGLMLLCKELFMDEGSQCIITWHMTTFLCSLGVLAGVVTQPEPLCIMYFQD